MMAPPAQSHAPSWEINAGITLWNMRNPYADEIVQRWFEESKENIGWGGDDQAELHKVLRSLLEPNFGVDSEEPPPVSRDTPNSLTSILPLAGHIIHKLRASVGAAATDWTGDSVQERMHGLIESGTV